MTFILFQSITFAGGPKLEFLYKEIKADSLREDMRYVYFYFSYINTGDSVAYIKSAQSDCGCTHAYVDPQEAVQPHKSGVLKVRYQTYLYKGDFIHPIKVKYNSSDPEEQIILHIEGMVY